MPRQRLTWILLACLLLLAGYALAAGTYVEITNSPPYMQDQIVLYYDTPPEEISIKDISTDPDGDNYTCSYNLTDNGTTYSNNSCIMRHAFNFTSYPLDVALNDSNNTNTEHVNLTLRPTNCSITFDPEASLENGTVNVSWEMPHGISEVTLAYTDNYTGTNTSTYNINFSQGHTMTTTNDHFIDEDAINSTDKRFYTVWTESTRHCSHTIGAYYDIELIKTSASSLNLVSFPIDIHNTTPEDILHPIYEQLNKAYWYDNQNKGFYSFIAMKDSDGDWVSLDLINEMRNHNGYWIDVKANTTLPVAGQMLSNTSLNLTPELNLNGFHTIQKNNSADAVLSQIYPELDRAYWYNNQDKSFYAFTVIENEGSYTSIGLFDRLRPLGGYYIEVKNSTVLTWPNS